jgi:hypothetical protein
MKWHSLPRLPSTVSRAQEAGAPLSPERRALIERVLGLQPSTAPQADGHAVPPVRPVAPELCAAMYLRKLAERVRLTVRPAGREYGSSGPLGASHLPHNR